MDVQTQPAWHWRRLAELAAALTPSGHIGDGMVAEMKRCGLVVLNDPIPLVLHCPTCGTQHIDKPKACTLGVGCEAGVCYAAAHDQPERCDAWTNPPHRSHECQHCGCIWRPCDLPTTGVATIATMGKADTWAPCSGGGTHVITPIPPMCVDLECPDYGTVHWHRK